MRRQILTLGLAATLAGWATSSSAYTIYVTPVASECLAAGCMPPPVVLNQLSSYFIVDFEEADLGNPATPKALPYTEGGATYSGDGAIWQNPMNGQAAPPSGDTSKYLTLPFPDGNAGGGTQIVDIDLGGQRYNAFGLYWGSMDLYNTLQFFLDGSQVGPDFNGTQVGSPANGDQINDPTNFYVTVVGLEYDAIRMRSTSFAFESDNHLFGSVPEPAGVALFGLGLLAMGARRLRRS